MRILIPLCLPILCAARLVHAAAVDTTIVGDGTPGPYGLGERFIDAGSLYIEDSADAAATLPPSTFVPAVNGVLFSEAIDNGRVLRARFETMFHGVRTTYSLFERRVMDSADTAFGPRVTSEGLSALNRSRADQLSVSGFKSIGVSVGSGGRMNLEQALEVRIFGEIAPRTELSANLSDQQTSLEGATREIGELDLVYIALTNPRYEVVAGDQFVSTPAAWILDSRKKIKGLSAGYATDRYRAKAWGAIAGGSWTSQRIEARVGRQGPYYLRGGGEADIIQPVRGTVRITADGEMLEEGRDKDFFVDYDLGAITFTPRFAVSEDQVIRAEYEYKTFDYQRTFTAAELGAALADSAVTVEGAIWYETDNKNHPIETVLGAAQRTALRRAGDNPPEALTGRLVDPRNAARENQLHRLYRLDTVATGPRYFFAPYDQRRPLDNQGLYRVTFRAAPAGQGDYVEARPTAPDQPDQCPEVAEDPDGYEDDDGCPDLDHRGPVYRYVGPGRGEYRATAPLPAPAREVVGELRARIAPAPWLRLSSALAGQERDRNLFSSRDDHDNTAAASEGEFALGRIDGAAPGVWLSGEYRLASARFDREVRTPYERALRWDREGDTASAAGHDWVAALGGRLSRDAEARLGYGRYVREGALLTDKLSARTHLGLGQAWALRHETDLFRHHDSTAAYVHRQTTALAREGKALDGRVHVDDEVRFDPGNDARGSIGGGLRARYAPFGLEEQLVYRRDFVGIDGAVMSADTGSHWRWTQTLHYSPGAAWRIGATSSWQRRTAIRDRIVIDSAGRRRIAPGDTASRSATLLTAYNDIASARTGFASRQEYRISSERASAFIQTPVYAGAGLGGYAYDPSSGEYVQSDTGSFLLYETAREVYDSSRGDLVRKSALSGDWSYRPPDGRIAGLLGDLGWRGTFRLEEHIRDESGQGPRSWLPGLTTLDSERDTAVTFSDLSYRQDIDWTPGDRDGPRLALYGHPRYRVQRSYRERSLEAGAEARRGLDPWSLGLGARILDVRRESSRGAGARGYAFRDGYLRLRQALSMGESWEAFLSETLGAAARTDSARAGESARDRAYVIAGPGLSFISGKRGFAQARYTIAWTGIERPVDYRMAQGYSGGLWHTLDIAADIRIGDAFSIGATYRMEYSRKINEPRFGPGLHVASLEVKAFL